MLPSANALSNSLLQSSQACHSWTLLSAPGSYLTSQDSAGHQPPHSPPRDTTLPPSRHPQSPTKARWHTAAAANGHPPDWCHVHVRNHTHHTNRRAMSSPAYRIGSTAVGSTVQQSSVYCNALTSTTRVEPFALSHAVELCLHHHVSTGRQKQNQKRMQQAAKESMTHRQNHTQPPHRHDHTAATYKCTRYTLPVMLCMS